jgi:uncharacterized protein YijF (DUF1287 family)
MRTSFILTLALFVAFGCRRSGADKSLDPNLRPASEEASRTPSGSAEAAEKSPAPRPSRPQTTDVGLFSTYDDAVEVAFPDWLDESTELRVRGPGGDVFAFVDGRAVALAPDEEVDFEVASFGNADRDGDGIPNGIDILLGAKKAAENSAAYGSPYREIDYPNGDVPTDEGVCTDTLVRTMRNAGLDLQKQLHEDIRQHPEAFPMVKDDPNPNIDHRRVKTLLPHFERRWTSLPTELHSHRPWLPGDVLFMDTYGDERPDHVGIIADRLGASGAPLVINNWTDGYSTSAMDVARLVPVTHRFRMPGELDVPAEHRGLEGVLRRAELTMDASHQQVVLVTVATATSAHGELRRYERTGDRFRLVGKPFPVTVGAGGLGTGRGLHPSSWSGLEATKREGDRRAPAGIFELGTAFGGGDAPYSGGWPWRTVGADDVFVDDPESDHYNTWQSDTKDRDWSSAERLSMYDLGLVVKHNTGETQPDAGSAIFLHTWQGDSKPTLGCTAMARDDLERLLGWLDPERSPVLVQLSGSVSD